MLRMFLFFTAQVDKLLKTSASAAKKRVDIRPQTSAFLFVFVSGAFSYMKEVETIISIQVSRKPNVIIGKCAQRQA